MKLPTTAERKQSLDDFAAKVNLGLSLAYEKLVRKEAREGGYLVLQRNGTIEKVPAVELLKELEAQKPNSESPGQIPRKASE